MGVTIAEPIGEMQVPGPPPRLTSKLMIALLVLVATELATLLLMLGVQRRMTTAYGRAVELSLESDTRESAFDEPEELASHMNDAPNNVYVTHDASGESTRMAAASLKFDRVLGDLSRQVARDPKARKLVARLDAIAATSHAMTNDSAASMAMFEAGNLKGAGELLAASDRRFTSCTRISMISSATAITCYRPIAEPTCSALLNRFGRTSSCSISPRPGRIDGTRWPS